MTVAGLNLRSRISLARKWAPYKRIFRRTMPHVPGEPVWQYGLRDCWRRHGRWHYSMESLREANGYTNS